MGTRDKVRVGLGSGLGHNLLRYDHFMEMIFFAITQWQMGQF